MSYNRNYNFEAGLYVAVWLARGLWLRREYSQVDLSSD